MALNGPGVPSNGMPRSRARGFRGLIRRHGSASEADANSSHKDGKGEFVDHGGRWFGAQGGVMPARPPCPRPGGLCNCRRTATGNAPGPNPRHGSQGCDRSVTFAPAPRG